MVASRYGIGVDNIDIPTATELGIVVTNVPDYCMDEVTDHAIGMILALNRRLGQHDAQVKAGGWAGSRPRPSPCTEPAAQPSASSATVASVAPSPTKPSASA